MTKREFMLQATLNGFVGFGHQTQYIGGEYIVVCAEHAWNRLEQIREVDEARERHKAQVAAHPEVPT